MIFNFLILFEDDTFKECGRSNDGGSIYVYDNGANFVIVNSESIKSHATSWGLFLYTCINTALKYNFVLYSTISESYYSSGSPYGTITLLYGQIRIISTNSSDNVCKYYSSFRLDAYDNSASSSQLNYSSEDSYLHYCYIMNNYANGYDCILFNYYKHTCEDSNIINNYQGTSSWGTLEAGSSSPVPTVIINKCCLIKNNANNKGPLFYSTGTMEVRECTIQSGYSISGSVTTSYSNTVAGIECAKIYYCGARIDRSCEICRCSDWDIVLMHKIHLVWTILKYIKLVCYNNIFIKYMITMNIVLYTIYIIFIKVVVYAILLFFILKKHYH
jgi:hypothetical protein